MSILEKKLSEQARALPPRARLARSTRSPEPEPEPEAAPVAGSEVALTWFGVGVQPPTPSFGAMIFEGSGARTFAQHPHLLLVPGLCVSALLFAFALLGDAINDVIRGR